MMEISFSHYPKPFQAVIKTLKERPTTLLSASMAFSRPPCKFINFDAQPSTLIMRKNGILKSGTVWMRSFLGPCFFIGASVKDNSGIVDRVAAGHFSARFAPFELERLFSHLLPIAPGEKISAFMAGSSQRFTEEDLQKNTKDIIGEFKRISLPLKVNTDIWHLPVLSDINMNNMVISDLGNKKREKHLTRMAYFGITPEDCMLFCTHRIGERIQRIRTITPDVGLIDL
ncbi:MAG: hypothetical protein NT030_07010 [Candidatus Saganbacteria bacterium]|nr:hypothetical protein [Candidatus Saganbacteria bacterium]